jgi:endonuclease/exonuclease/phosphatase family metal-dependent hydrolase
MHVIRVATQNIWGFHGDWPNRRTVLIDGLRQLQPDLVAFQEAIVTADYDQPRDLLGPDFHLAHQPRHWPDGGGVTIASRWPIANVRELESDTIAAQIEAPLGPLLFVDHCPRYELDNELTRERENVAAARLVEEMRDDHHVVLAGDLNARPESAGLRFLLGLQSLDGMSVCYRDAWEAAHPGEPGHTFTPENPTMPTGEKGHWLIEPGRRIDYVLVRCSDHGPTLDIRSCERLFDRPVRGTWASDHFGVTADLATHLPDGRPVP